MFRMEDDIFLISSNSKHKHLASLPRTNDFIVGVARALPLVTYL